MPTSVDTSDMARLCERIAISRPPDEVFDWVVEPSHLPAWQTHLVEAHLTNSAPVQTGSTFWARGAIAGREVIETGEFLEFTPGQSFNVTGDAPEACSQATYSFFAHDEGTMMVVSIEFRIKSVGKRLLSPLIGLAGKLTMKRYLLNLKDILERERVISLPRD